MSTRGPWFTSEQWEARDKLLSKHQPSCDVCLRGLVTPDSKWCWCEALGKWFKQLGMCHSYDDFEPTEDYDGWLEWMGEEEDGEGW